MNPDTKAKLLQVNAAVHAFLLKPSKNWVVVLAGVVGAVLGVTLF